MTRPQSFPSPAAMESPNDTFLAIEHIHKQYPKADGSQFVVLEDINLTIGAQEYVSVIGHSGCGKSTLLRIVAGLEKPSAGHVTLEGKLIRRPGADRMMVFQGYALLPWLTVRDNIRLAVDEVHKHLSKGDRRHLVNEHIHMVNLTAAADKYPHELSGGMKQRVGVARALATRPKMLLLDEPFGALDALTRPKLQTQVLDIWENHRQAVMMITHDIDEALFMSDKIVMLTNGPQATIGQVLTVDLPRPRHIHELRETQKYYDLRNEALDFLERYQ
ncbi:ABC transporter ATP-binding protein [Picosynechococcus sp. PCC 7117]|uniref:ABC transporter ATP-binding protein n=1 Tax=Picosynechococcus sp. PCC 7117 TaxID=195498 RepID=UPI00081032BD|nr:nitrate ABC transporter ATP-binding protein [Picosynechococcus sp. PCC 7117]ANV89027.1 bacitracin ABC transporter ATP-binding protein [Picosynechococcus sp. PCC 7117]